MDAEHDLPQRVETRLDGRKIRDMATFHAACAASLGFPGYYGHNGDAWIDCMTYVDAPWAGMTARHVAPGGTYTLVLEGAADLRARCPQVLAKLRELIGFVNARCAAPGKPPLLELREA